MTNHTEIQQDQKDEGVYIHGSDMNHQTSTQRATGTINLQKNKIKHVFRKIMLFKQN